MSLHFTDLLNKEFNTFTVVERMPDADGSRWWRCLCKCGVERILTSGEINAGKRKCKCARRIRPYERLYNRMVDCAKRKNRPISLTYEDFVSFTNIERCYYCGDKIIWTEFDVRQNGIQHEKLSYNLDRKDNSIGYTKANCAVCCYICNRMKSTLSEGE
jgi:hypothetical protein